MKHPYFFVREPKFFGNPSTRESVLRWEEIRNSDLVLALFSERRGGVLPFHPYEVVRRSAVGWGGVSGERMNEFVRCDPLSVL